MPRKPSAYMIFSKEKRPEIKEANPECKVTEIAKKLGAMWREMSDEDKKPYQEEAKNAAPYEPKPKRAKRGENKKPKRGFNADGTPKPKRAPTSYMKFANAKRPEVREAHPDLKITEIAKKLGAMWRELTEDEKKSYKS